MNVDVIIIRGAPGSGKSQAAKCLAAHFPKGVRFEVDTLRAMVISVDWTNQAEHINLLSLATGLVHGFHKMGCSPVILVDTFSGNKLGKFVADLHSLDATLKVQSFALVTAPEILRDRVTKRSPDKFNDITICQKLNADVLKYLQPFEQLIDNTELTPAATAKVIMDKLAEPPGIPVHVGS